MSADIRLDPATLRWCAAKLRAGLLASLECTMNNTCLLYTSAAAIVRGIASALESKP